MITRQELIDSVVNYYNTEYSNKLKPFHITEDHHAEILQNIQEGHGLYDIMVQVEADYHSTLCKIKKTYFCHMNDYKAVEMFGKEAVKEMCDEKIRAREAISRFSNLKSMMKGNKRRVNQMQIDQAATKPIEEILDHFGIRHYRGRCVCQFCEGNNQTKFSYKNNLWKCFACEAKGNSITFIKLYTKEDNFLTNVNLLLKI